MVELPAPALPYPLGATPGEADGAPPGLPRLDLAALRAALVDRALPLVLARHRAGLLGHPRAGDLAGLRPDFHFACRCRPDALAPLLRKALRQAGLGALRMGEAVAAEASHLVRTFAGLADDPQPAVRLALVDADHPLPVPAPSPTPSTGRLALVYALAPPAPARQALPAARLAAALGLAPGDLGGLAALPPDTAAVLRPAAAPPAVTLPLAAGAGRSLVLWVESDRAPLAAVDFLPAPPAPVEVLLASMPFGTLDQPSLALSLLRATLAPRPTAVLYLTLPVARRIGVPLYNWITDCQPQVSALLGEWLFGALLAPRPAAAERRYLDEVLLAPTARWWADPGDVPCHFTLVPEALVEDLLALRRSVFGFLDACVEAVLAYRPRVVGLTSVFQQHAASLALARRLKERAPEVAVVLGGANCEGPMGLATARLFDGVDAVVCGEGEGVLPELVERLLAGRPIDDLEGVYTRRSPEVAARAPEPANAPGPRHLDDLPYPECDDFFVQLAGHGLADRYPPRLLLETARGCWWGEKQHCTFCGLNGTTMAFRSKSPERALAELTAFARRYPGLPIGMADNILDPRYFKTLLPRLAGQELDLALFYEVKANLKKDEVRALRAAGVKTIQPGIESLSDEVLRRMRKGVKALQNVQLLKWCQECEVWPFYNLLWGFPGEPEAAYGEMARLLPLLHHLPPPAGMSPMFLERFSPNHFASDELGFAAVRPVPAYGHIYPVAEEELEDLAYFFSYRHRDGRDVARYTRPLAARIVEWREAYETSRLAFVDRGDDLMLLDTRPLATQTLGFVEGLGRTLYLAADGIQTLDGLCRIAAAAAGEEVPRQAVEECLGPWIDRGWMLRQGDAVLALALPAELGASAGETA